MRLVYKFILMGYNKLKNKKSEKEGIYGKFMGNFIKK